MSLCEREINMDFESESLGEKERLANNMTGMDELSRKSTQGYRVRRGPAE